MSRYINVDTIRLPKGFFETVDNVPKFYEWLESLPPADVVEATLCKDCVFGRRYFDVQNGETDSWVECTNPDGLNRDVSDEGYCSAGIRRGERSELCQK